MAFSTFLDPTTMLLGGVLVLLLLWWLYTRRPPGLPPGPGPALPLLGHLYLMKKNPLAKFKTWRRQYGDVFSLYMGGQLVVMLNGYPAIKEALVKFADVFSHRPKTYVSKKLSDNKGIIASSGNLWKEQRKTSLEILRVFGMGKNMQAEKIQEEVTHYIRAIEDFQGSPTDLATLTTNSVSNNICSIVFGKRFEYDDPSFKSYMSTMDQFFRILGGTALMNFFPFMDFIPGDLSKAKSLTSCSKVLRNFVEEQMAEHMNENPQEATDFIHAYRHHIRRREMDGNVSTTLNEDNLHACIRNLFLAGTETTSTALRWAMLLFLHYPEVQDKCYKEICDVIGPDQTPSMRHKKEMTYLEATTLELLRKGDIVPLSISHGMASDVTFRGYHIPKNAIVIPNLSSALQDPDVWGDPENFRPERFIGPDGKLQREEELIPFGIGRRVCLGESLARMELFLYLSNLIQHFRFLPPEDDPLPCLKPDFGLTYTPTHYKIRAVPRK